MADIMREYAERQANGDNITELNGEVPISKLANKAALGVHYGIDSRGNTINAPDIKDKPVNPNAIKGTIIDTTNLVKIDVSAK